MERAENRSEEAPKVVDFAEYKERRERERRKQLAQDALDALALLTDAQLEAAVFLNDPNDAERLDVVRFFLQELARRDEERALAVFRRWKNGEKA